MKQPLAAEIYRSKDMGMVVMSCQLDYDVDYDDDLRGFFQLCDATSLRCLLNGVSQIHNEKLCKHTVKFKLEICMCICG